MAAAKYYTPFYTKVLALMCCVVVLLGVVDPPRAKAVAVVDDIAIIAAVFVASCGLTWAVTNSTGDDFKTAIGDKLSEYCASIGTTVTDWVGNASASMRSPGVLSIPKALAQGLAAFSAWLVGKTGITAGESAVIQSGTLCLLCADGTLYQFVSYNYDDGSYNGTFLQLGTDLILDSGAKIVWSDLTAKFYLSDGSLYSSYTFQSQNGTDTTVHQRIGLSYNSTSNTFSIRDQWVKNDYSAFYSLNYGWSDMKNKDISLLGSLLNSGQVDLTAEGVQEITYPNTDALTDDQALAITVPGTEATALDSELQAILDAILAGTLATPTTEAVNADEAEAGEVTDIDDLGLPSLSAIITTKFPFSIPWDIVRGIKLLAAPPEAPHWSVDFMSAFEYRVGSWGGDTTVTLDMADYPIVGEVCRWTSTIGFCILLAAATKKLAWVA